MMHQVEGFALTMVLARGFSQRRSFLLLVCWDDQDYHSKDTVMPQYGASTTSLIPIHMRVSTPLLYERS
jgi:hypothetical protein